MMQEEKIEKLLFSGDTFITVLLFDVKIDWLYFLYLEHIKMRKHRQSDLHKK
jgi:hypothetical protein